jgi:hypothetical protein
MKGFRVRRFLGITLMGMALIPIFLATPTNALGYTDPGTGTFAYQAIYAAFIGGTFYLRKFLKRFFGKGPDGK